MGHQWQMDTITQRTGLAGFYLRHMEHVMEPHISGQLETDRDWVNQRVDYKRANEGGGQFLGFRSERNEFGRWRVQGSGDDPPSACCDPLCEEGRLRWLWRHINTSEDAAGQRGQSAHLQRPEREAFGSPETLRRGTLWWLRR